MTDQTIKDLGSIADNSRVESIKQLARGFADSLTRREGDKTLLEWRNDLSLYGTSSSVLSKDEKRVLVGMLDRLRELHADGICHGNINVSSILISDYEVKMIDPLYTEFSVANVERDYSDLANVIRQFRQKLPMEVEHLVKHLWKNGHKHPVYIFNAPCTWSTMRICMVIEYLANQRRRIASICQQDLNDAISSASGKDWKAHAETYDWLAGMFDRPRPCILQFMRDVYAHPPPFNGKHLDDIGVTQLFYEIFPDLIAKLIMEVVERGIVVPGDFIDRHYVGTASSYFAKLPF